MKLNLAQWGNSLHSGEKVYPIVPQRKRWFAVSAVLIAASIALLLIKGLNPGIDFSGGTEFRVTDAPNPDTAIAQEVVDAAGVEGTARITVLGENDVRVQIGVVESETARELTTELADAYEVDAEAVSFTQIGPTWGAEVGKKAVQGLVIFLILVTVVMSLYFRAWRMAAAALIALAHDLIITVGVYALVGFEVTPASVIGFLTILGYSLYDTVVVFDKVRENTANLTSQHRYTYDELANLALNQTLVRSINTSVVALLPVSAILFIGAFVLGAGTLQDIALALFVGMAVGTYSSIFVATPAEVALRDSETKIKEHTQKVLAMRESGSSDVTIAADGSVRVGAVDKGAHQGSSAQPRRKNRKA
ncbi:protein translocase subunit SecF [Demequina sp. SYSU T00039]|uniref:Protein-export membrane protein SecF n=1 Tax=Demequina lignilytica TaxID=3051663 RepID=A0AAW7LZR2_9MICO|nr:MULTISPECIES: protein translocase subunit SecF [unclassified Demequina]MDN4486733.1 protein translocase subunit SecF [Demequina sp. SYSU T00039]MDN4489417.1 protein translocase subunit SecF [Demequina sp. SYSU T00068]